MPPGLERVAMTLVSKMPVLLAIREANRVRTP